MTHTIFTESMFIFCICFHSWLLFIVVECPGGMCLELQAHGTDVALTLLIHPSLRACLTTPPVTSHSAPPRHEFCSTEAAWCPNFSLLTLCLAQDIASQRLPHAVKHMAAECRKL